MKSIRNIIALPFAYILSKLGYQTIPDRYLIITRLKDKWFIFWIDSNMDLNMWVHIWHIMNDEIMLAVSDIHISDTFEGMKEYLDSVYKEETPVKKWRGRPKKIK